MGQESDLRQPLYLFGPPFLYLEDEGVDQWVYEILSLVPEEIC